MIAIFIPVLGTLWRFFRHRAVAAFKPSGHNELTVAGKAGRGEFAQISGPNNRQKSSFCGQFCVTAAPVISLKEKICSEGERSRRIPGRGIRNHAQEVEPN